MNWSRAHEALSQIKFRGEIKLKIRHETEFGHLKITDLTHLEHTSSKLS